MLPLDAFPHREDTPEISDRWRTPFSKVRMGQFSDGNPLRQTIESFTRTAFNYG